MSMEEKKLKIQDILLNAGNSACLALCYSVVAEMGKQENFNPNVFASQLLLFADIFDAYNSGLVDDEFFVKDAEKLLKYLDPDPKKKFSVIKKDIESLKDLRGEIACVRFDYNGNSHWVLAADGIIVFDSLSNSICRKYGKPTTARICKVEEV